MHRNPSPRSAPTRCAPSTNPCRSVGTRGDQSLLAATDLLTASCTEHPPNISLPPHSHPNATLTVVLGGGYRENVGGSDQGLPSMTAVVKPAETRHSNTVDQRGARCFLLELPAYSVGDIQAVRSVFSSVRIIDLTRAADLVIRVVCEKVTGLLAVESLSMELIGIVAEEASGFNRATKSGRWLARVRDRLHMEPDGNLRLSALATDAGCHPVYLARAFRRTFGESIGTYAHRLRLARAAREVGEHPRKSLSEIAHKFGYYDHSHFSHEFRARTGATPGQWRERARGIHTAR